MQEKPSAAALASAPPQIDAIPQTRAAILHSGRVFTADRLASALNRLADHGWNSVVFPGFLEGYPVFPSETHRQYHLKPQHPKFRKWNPLEVAFDVAWRRGLNILLAVKPYLIEGLDIFRPPILKRFPRWAAQPHPNQKKADRTTQSPSRYYCPVNPEFRRFLGDLLCNLVENYPFHGLLIDLRDYPFHSVTEQISVSHCFCKVCRQATLDALGFDPVGVNFKKEVNMVERWLEWQTAQMDQAMAYLRMRCLKARCTIRVLGLLTTDSGIGPDKPHPLIHWKSWVERGLVEALVLDRYSSDPMLFESQICEDLATLPEESLLLPMLPQKSCRDDSFLDIYGKYPLPGLCTRFADWDQAEFDPSSRIVFDEPAFCVEADPIFSIRNLFDRMIRISGNEVEFAEFLSDLQRILCRDDMPMSVERLKMIAENIRGLYTRVLKGHIDFGARRERMLHDLDLCSRLAYLAGTDLVG